MTKALFYGRIFTEDKILPSGRAGSGSMAPGCPVSPEKARLHNERRGTHLIFRKGEKNMTMKETLRKKAKGKKGFTLVELVIVIAVLAIIAAIAIPTVTNVINNANSSADQSNAQSIELAIKTAQSEVAANNTNESTNATTVKGSEDKTLKFLLKTYGVDADSVGLFDGGAGDKLKVAGQHFYYNANSGKVVAATGQPKDYTLLTASTKYTVKEDTLTIGEATST